VSQTDVMLLTLAYLLAKHALADFFFQTAYQWKNKGRYGHPGGILHAGIHTLMTLPAFLIIAPPSLAYAATIAAAEFVVHYHIDWTKEQAVRGLTPQTDGFWRSMGIDQLAHGLTYLAIVRALVEPL
jgi:hypothetical protein